MSSQARVWIEPLKRSSTHLRKLIVKEGPTSVILALCELALNYNLGNLKIKPSPRQIDFINQLADRTISVQRKRVFLHKPAGVRLLKVLLS